MMINALQVLVKKCTAKFFEIKERWKLRRQ